MSLVHQPFGKVAGVPRSLFFWCPECVVSNFVRLLILEILGYARDTAEGFALVARFLHYSRLVERSAAEFAQEQPSTEYREGASMFAAWVLSI